MRTAEVCSKHGISQPTFYGWKARYGGRTVPTATLLQQLKNENEHLRRLLSEALLTNAVMKGGTLQKG
jgi:putative transposase